LDTVSRQIFGNIQETQFSGNKMEVNIHLKNAFQAELETKGSCYNLWFSSHPSIRPNSAATAQEWTNRTGRFPIFGIAPAVNEKLLILLSTHSLGHKASK